MRRIGIATFALLVSNLFFVRVVDTFTIKPPDLSGNGNPGIVALGMGWLLLVAFGVLYWIWMSGWIKSRRTDAVLFFVSICVLGVSLALEARHVAERLDALGGLFDDPESRLIRFGAVNPYTNTFYYNGYAVAATIALLSAIRTGTRWLASGDRDSERGDQDSERGDR